MMRAKPPALVLALAALLLVLVVAAGWLGVNMYKAHAAAQDKTLALQTAREVATNLTTITSDNFAGQIDALTKVSTQSFKEQMTGYSAMFQALLKQGNVALRGTVTGAGIEKMEGDSAAALITVSTLVTSGQQPQGQPQSFGLLVSLQRDGDHWLASNVDFLR
jgi:Mce-associated membrane protein